MPDTAHRPPRGAVPWIPLLVLGAIVIFFAVVRLRLLDIPLERDEGEYAYTAQIMHDGWWPYRDVYSMKLPGIFLVYAGIMRLFGQTVVGIHLGLLLAVSVSTVLIFFLARRFIDDASALVATVCFALLSSSRAVTGFAANAEPFILPFVLTGILLLYGALESRRPRLRLFWSGLAFGAAVLVKQHGAAFGLFGGLYLLAALIRRRKSAPPGRIALVFSAFAAGAVLPFAVACLVFVGAGVFRPFWFYTTVYARTYVSQATASEAFELFLFQSSRVILTDPLIWSCAVIGLVFVLSRRWPRTSRLVLLGLAAASCLAVMPGFYFRSHYFVLAFPAAALGAGAAAMKVFSFLRAHLSPRLARTATATLVLILVGGQVYLERGMLFAADGEDASWQMYGPLPFGMNKARDIAVLLKPKMSAGDTVAVMASEPQIYFYLKKKAPTGFIYLYYLTEGQPYAERMQREFISDIERARPEYLIYTSSWKDEFTASGPYEALMGWYRGFRDQNYTLIGLVDSVSRRTTVVRWDGAARNFRSHSAREFLIYRRNDTSPK